MVLYEYQPFYPLAVCGIIFTALLKLYSCYHIPSFQLQLMNTLHCSSKALFLLSHTLLPAAAHEHPSLLF
jgi:hypothetical protein